MAARDPSTRSTHRQLAALHVDALKLLGRSPQWLGGRLAARAGKSTADDEDGHGNQHTNERDDPPESCEPRESAELQEAHPLSARPGELPKATRSGKHVRGLRPGLVDSIGDGAQDGSPTKHVPSTGRRRAPQPTGTRTDRPDHRRAAGTATTAGAWA